MVQRALAQALEGSRDAAAFDNAAHMLGDGAQNLRHAGSRGVGHCNQLFEFLPRLGRIDGLRREPDPVGNRRRAAADVEGGAAVEQHDIARGALFAIEHAAHDDRALRRVATVQLFEATAFEGELLRLDRVFRYLAVAQLGYFGRTTERDFIKTLQTDRKSTRLNSSHSQISYAVFCL